MRLAIFDMGGVVADNVALLSAMYTKLGMKKEDFIRFSSGAEVAAEEEQLAYQKGLIAGVQMGHISSIEFWQLFSSRSGINVSENYWDTLFHPILNEATLSVIKDLKKQGIPIVCGTNVLDVHYERHLAEGHYSIFDRVYASHLMGVIKPFSDFWIRICDAENDIMRCQGMPPFSYSDVCFIDDNSSNILAAKRLGLNALVFTGAERLRQDLAVVEK